MGQIIHGDSRTDSVPAICAENISKTYPPPGLWRAWRDAAARPALSNVSFVVQKGEMVGLLGPNGSGKTTLLKIVANVLSPTSGRVLIEDRDVSKLPARARNRLGLVTCDERSFYWRLSGRQNLYFFAALYGLSPKPAKERIAMLLEVLGLTEAADSPFYGYSSGMKQKLAIARGLLSDPAVVLYDEPTRNLDPVSANNIRKWITRRRLESVHTAHLIATNQLHEAEEMCDRVLIVNKGVLLALGTVAEIRQMLRSHEITETRVFCKNHLQMDLSPAPMQGLIDVSKSADDDGRTVLSVRAIEGSEGLSLVLRRVLRDGGSVIRCEAVRLSFDEVFRALIAEQSSSRTKGAA